MLRLLESSATASYLLASRYSEIIPPSSNYIIIILISMNQNQNGVSGYRAASRVSARDSNTHNLQSRARPEDAYSNYQHKMKALGRVKYINQLARLEYEDKLTELHSKYTTQTKKSVQNKLKARNQIAEFIDEQEQLDQQFEQLMDYKYGASKWKNFYFQKENQKKEEFGFCPLCDEIYAGSAEDHQNDCNYRELSMSPIYYFESLNRIKVALDRVGSRESEELVALVEKIRASKNVSPELQEIKQASSDILVEKIICKLEKLIEETQN